MAVETTLNAELARHLRAHGLNARGEVRLRGGGAGQADVLISLPPHRVIIEAKRGQTAARESEAVSQCRDRLENNHCQASVAVCYPDGATEYSLPTDILKYTMIDVDGGRLEWTTGTAESLAAYIKRAPAQLGNADLAAAVLGGEIDKALDHLSLGQKTALSQRLDLPAANVRTGRKDKKDKRYDTAAKRGMLVIASAVMFHARLDNHLAGSRPAMDARTGGAEEYRGHWPPASAQDCARSRDVIGAYSRAWSAILALDYKPVFQTAIAGLDAPGADPRWSAAVGIVADAALSLARDIAGGRQDVMGRLFHRVLDTARYDGSFYTGTAGAALLSTLAVRQSDRDWNDLDALSDFVVIDPAAGTGTLPIAVAARIRDLAPQSETLSKALVEDMLHAYDVNLTATHMAATTMGLMSPTTEFNRMNVHRVRLGPTRVETGPDGKRRRRDVSVGSLEYLAERPFPSEGWPVYGLAGQVDSGEDVNHEMPQADLFVMNPPFTRDSLRFDQFNRKDELEIKRREEELLACAPAHRTNAAGGFIALAQRKLKEGGRLAMILPLVGAQNNSGKSVRKSLAKNTRIEFVVAIKDPENLAFSENTAISEMVVIATKGEPDPDASTRFVKILRNPRTPAQAVGMGDAILRGESRADFIISDWPQERMRKGDWLPTQFVRNECESFFLRMLDGEWFTVATNSDVLVAKNKHGGELGPDGRGIRDAFSRSPQPESRQAIWFHKSDVQTTMKAKAESYLDVRIKAGKERQARRHWEQRANVMLPMRMSTPTNRVAALYAERAAVGSAFAPYTPNRGEHEQPLVDKACVAFLNSSIGLIALLGVTSNRKIVYPNWSMDDLREIPFPRWAALSETQVSQMAQVYESLADRPFKPLREMGDCDTRLALDRAVSEALGVSWDEMETLRAALASEPGITGKRFAGA